MSGAAGAGTGGADETTRKPRATMRIGPYATRVVALSLLGVVCVVVLLLIAASKNTYEVHAVFDDVRGLIPGGDVTAGSIVVGKVTDVELNDHKDPEVVMQIDNDFQLHQGAFANIKLASNVGAVNRVVDLTQGDLSLPELGDGTTLMGKQTDNPVDFDLAVSTLTPKVRGDIKKILINLDVALKHRGPDFERTLQNSTVTLNETANLLGEVNADGAALKTLVSQGQRVVTALAADPQDLGEATDRLAELLQVTGARQTELAATTRELGPALAAGRQLLDGPPSRCRICRRSSTRRSARRRARPVLRPGRAGDAGGGAVPRSDEEARQGRPQTAARAAQVHHPRPAGPRQRLSPLLDA